MADETEIKKPANMLEALELASELVENSLIKTFCSVRNHSPEMSIGSSLRMYHFSLINSFKKSDTSTLFQPALGLIAKCLLHHLTDEEKEALHNDKLTNLL